MLRKDSNAVLAGDLNVWGPQTGSSTLSASSWSALERRRRRPARQLHPAVLTSVPGCDSIRRVERNSKQVIITRWNIIGAHAVTNEVLASEGQHRQTLQGRWAQYRDLQCSAHFRPAQVFHQPFQKIVHACNTAHSTHLPNRNFQLRCHRVQAPL